MIAFSLQKVAHITNGELIGDDKQIAQVATDSRHIAPDCLFVALVGERFDAHHFAADAVNGGAAALLVSRRLPLAVAQVVVADTRIALGQLAAWVRQQSTARVVALTGSSGKTSVKEMTAAILRQCGETLYTAGNFNNDIGVPLTLLRLTPAHRYAVIELGANHQGEIAHTVSLTRPVSALVNNLAAAHLEGFGTLAGVAAAKGEIFNDLPENGIAIINAESNDWPRWKGGLQNKTVWRFSVNKQEDSDFYASDICITGQGTHFMLHSPAGNTMITLPLPGRHNIANALAAAALAMSVGASLKVIANGLASVKAVPGRLFPQMLADGKRLLDDSYNANVGSMKAAITTLATMPGFRVLVAGDMAELGDEAAACHRLVGEAAALSGINKVLTVGELSHAIASASGVGEHFATKAELIECLRQLLSEKDTITILVKGSRSAAMEQVIQALQEKGKC